MMRTPDRAAAGLMGPVETVVSRFVALEPNGVERVQHSVIDEYDDGGLLTSRTSYKADGSLWYRSAQRYDADGRLCETQHENSDGTGGIQKFGAVPPRQTPRVHRFSVPKLKENDGFGYHVEGVENTWFSASAGQRIAIFYDPHGRPQDVKIRSRFGVPVGRITFAYDSHGRLTNVANYGWHDTFRGSTESPLPHFVTELIAPVAFWILRTAFFWRSLFMYLRRRDFVRVRRSFAYGTVVDEEFRVYDEAGRVVEERHVSCGGPGEDRTTRSYDDRGLLLEQAFYDEQGKLQSKERYTREFDDHGNWTKEVVVRWPRGCDGSATCNMEGEATFVTSRTITYTSA